MKLRNLALVTALTSVTALSAQAQDTQGHTDTDELQPVAETGETTDTANPANPEKHADDYGLEPVGEQSPQASMDMDGNITAPAGMSLMGKDMTKAEQTLTKNILAEADKGSKLMSVDDKLIGKVTMDHGNEGSDHLIYVDVDKSADIMAERLAFRASTLSVEQGGGLEYTMSLAQLRAAVAERVAK